MRTLKWGKIASQLPFGFVNSRRSVHRDVACRYITMFDGSTFMKHRYTFNAEITLCDANGKKIATVLPTDKYPSPKLWECINCGELDKSEVAEELYGDQSWISCDACGSKPYRIRYENQLPAPRVLRPRRFCFFIKPKDEHPAYYTRLERFFLALRIGYYKEAWQLLRGKPSNYIWEGMENNPMPF